MYYANHFIKHRIAYICIFRRIHYEFGVILRYVGYADISSLPLDNTYNPTALLRIHLLSMLEDLVVYNLPEDTYAKFVGAVTGVTAADEQRLAARYIQPDKMAVVVVGDRKSIEGPIRQLNLGPVHFITIDELFR